jgi:hypothetical protein
VSLNNLAQAIPYRTSNTSREKPLLLLKKDEEKVVEKIPYGKSSI